MPDLRCGGQPPGPASQVHGLREAVAAVRAAGRRAVVALPRIVKPEEERVLLFYLRIGADALLVRGAGVLQQLAAAGGPGAAMGDGAQCVPALEGDFSLNAANALSADALLRCGLARLAPTHDLNAAQIQVMSPMIITPPILGSITFRINACFISSCPTIAAAAFPGAAAPAHAPAARRSAVTGR